MIMMELYNVVYECIAYYEYKKDCSSSNWVTDMTVNSNNYGKPQFLN